MTTEPTTTTPLSPDAELRVAALRLVGSISPTALVRRNRPLVSPGALARVVAALDAIAPGVVDQHRAERGQKPLRRPSGGAR